MKKIFLLLCCMTSTSRILAQHTVSGIVSDKADNTHLVEGVMVYIPEFNRTDISKEGGTYILRNVGIGIIHLQFTKHGFKTVVQTISTKDSATVINIELEPVTGITEELTAISDLDKLPENTPFDVDVFSATRLRRTGTIDYLAALNYQPGIDKVSVGNLGTPVIRGLSCNHLLMYQSGTRIETPSWNELQDHGMIEEGTDLVEVIKGPASLIYGDNAMGGVMIFRDEKMPVSGTTSGDVNLGLFNNTLGINIDAGIKGSEKNGLFYSFRLGGRSHTSYIMGQGDYAAKNTEVKDFAYNSGLFSEMIKGMAGISKKWGQSRLTFSYRKYENELIRSLTDAEIVAIEDNKERDRKSLTPYNGQVTYLVSSENVILVKESQVNLNMSYQYFERNDYKSDDYMQTLVSINSLMQLSTLSYDYKFISNKSKKFGYTAGMQGYLQNDKNTSYGLFLSDDDISDFSAYALARYDLQKINFLGGFRFTLNSIRSNYSYNDEDYNMMSGSAGLAWHPESNLTFKLNASSGNGIPSSEQRKFVPIESYNRNIVGNINLTEEKNYEGDFGFIWEHPSVTINLSAYYNMINQYIYLERTYIDYVTHVDDYFYVQANANLKGGEFSLNLHPSSVKWLSLESSYSLVRGEFSDSKDDLPNMPSDKIVTALYFKSERMNYMYRPYISIVMSNHLKKENIYYYETAGNSYSLFDLHFGGSFILGQQMFDITLSVMNILDEDYYNNLSLTKNMLPVAVRDMGRNVSLQLHVPFGIKK